MRALSAAALSLALAGQAAADEWIGVWAADPAWCANADRIGQAEQAPVRITAEAIEGLENRCEITNVSPLGVGDSWRVDQLCTGEGMTDRTSELLLLGADGDLIRYTEEGFAIRMTRCE